MSPSFRLIPSGIALIGGLAYSDAEKEIIYD